MAEKDVVQARIAAPVYRSNAFGLKRITVHPN